MWYFDADAGPMRISTRMARTLHPGDAVYFVCAGEFSNVTGSSVALKVGGIISFASKAN